MKERELAIWLDALEEAGLIRDWHWEIDEQQRGPTIVGYWINGRPYTHAGAVKLVRDFEANTLRPV